MKKGENQMLQLRLLIYLLAAVSAAAQAPAPVPPLPPKAPQAPAPPVRASRAARVPGDEFNVFLYETGQAALDNHAWEQALDKFNQVIASGNSRTEGALYWKAYALNKLGRRDEALASIAELRKAYPSSRWLEDAKVLEMETRQASGQPVSPENESDEDLKLLALNGLMQSDPDRALPLVENLLKGNQSPNLKRNAVYVIAQNSSPRAQQLLEQVARGSANPDLQIVAIRYLAQQKRNQLDVVRLLWEIYGSTGDVNVKREIVNRLSTDQLLQVAKSDKAPELRLLAIQRLGNGGGGDALVAIYAAETDAQVRQAIINTFSSQRNAKALVALARAERDPQVKKAIVQHLVNMKSPDATDYLLEILK
jgi:tetratricopeptide (TPR) repeat protein